LPLFLLSSKTWYPGISSFVLEGFNHVSWMHNTSTVCVYSIMYSLNRLIPAIFILPIVNPCVCHLCSLSFFVLRNRADPFVRFFLLTVLVYYIHFCPHTFFYLCSGLCYYRSVSILFILCFSCARTGTLFLMWFFSIISSIWAALAQWGAIPYSKPAGQKLGG
jgi:hypothetical protein